MAGSKPRKDKVKAGIEQSYHAKPRIDGPNTPSGHSGRMRQSDEGKASQ